MVIDDTRRPGFLNHWQSPKSTLPPEGILSVSQMPLLSPNGETDSLDPYVLFNITLGHQTLRPPYSWLCAATSIMQYSHVHLLAARTVPSSR